MDIIERRQYLMTYIDKRRKRIKGNTISGYLLKTYDKGMYKLYDVPSLNGYLVRELFDYYFCKTQSQAEKLIKYMIELLKIEHAIMVNGWKEEGNGFLKAQNSLM